MGPLRGFIAPTRATSGRGSDGREEKGGGEARRACGVLYTLRDKIFRGTVNVGSPVCTPGSYQGEEGSGRSLQLPMAIFRPNRRHRPESFHARVCTRSCAIHSHL